MVTLIVMLSIKRYIDKIHEEEMITLKEVIERLLTSVVKVIEKQMNEYIDDNLSHLSSSMITQAKSAPVHNMFSEQTLALADHQFRKSPISKVGFIDGKVKAKKTRPWSGCLRKWKKIKIKLLPLLSKEHD